MKPASWVIREKTTGQVMMETSDPAKVTALNTEKYCAIPIQSHLHSLLLRQRAADGYPVGADKCLRESYGPIPGCRQFLDGQGAIGNWCEPEFILGWMWSTTFGRWGAYVLFNGKVVYTFPMCVETCTC